MLCVLNRLSFVIVLFGACVVAGIGLVGCNADRLPSPTEARQLPPMPTTGPLPTPTSSLPTAAESEIIATATRQALASDGAAVVRTLELAVDPAVRARLGTEVVAALASKNPASAAAVTLALPVNYGKSDAAEIVARAWVQQNSAEALRWALAPPNPTAAHEMRRAIAIELARENPSATLEWLKALPSATPSRDDMLGLTAAAWARSDVAAATAWLRSQPNDSLRQQMTASVAFEIAQKNPDQAIALAESIPAGRNRWLVFTAIAQTWIVKDPKPAVIWATQLPPGEGRDAAFAGVDSGLGLGSSRATISIPTSGAGSVVSRDLSPNNVSSPLRPELNSPAFTAWLATQPRAMSRDEAILEFVRQRSSTDLGAIGTWIAGLAGEPSRQRAMEIYLDQTVRSSPASAADWLRSLPASSRSDDMIEKTARELIHTDPRAAEALLRDTNFPPHRQEEILRNAPR